MATYFDSSNAANEVFGKIFYMNFFIPPSAGLIQCRASQSIAVNGLSTKKNINCGAHTGPGCKSRHHFKVVIPAYTFSLSTQPSSSVKDENSKSHPRCTKPQTHSRRRNRHQKKPKSFGNTQLVYSVLRDFLRFRS